MRNRGHDAMPAVGMIAAPGVECAAGRPLRYVPARPGRGEPGGSQVKRPGKKKRSAGRAERSLLVVASVSRRRGDQGGESLWSMVR